MLNPDPLIEALETVTLAVLVFLTARVWEFLLPTATVPNDTDDGVEVSLDVDPEAVPLSATVTSAVPLLFFNVKLPVNVPDAVGWNAIAK
jgi:hypothetical protein